MATILVIDDNKLLTTHVVEGLIQDGHTVYSAGDGALGLELARGHLPDLILCDVAMPHLDGYGVIEALRFDSSTATIPVVLMTALATEDGFRRGMETGADDYLAKPFTLEQLKAAIDARLHKQALVRQQSEHMMRELRNNIILALPHEMRTPLFGILGAADMIMEDSDKLPPAVNEMMSNIISSGQRILRLVDNFTIYAQIELMASDPEYLESKKSQSPKTLLCLIEPSIRDLAQAKVRSADLQLSLIDAPVAMPADFLSKLCYELVDNAFKFSDQGTAVLVSSRLNGPFVELCVEDNGCGMSPEEISAMGALTQFQRRLREQQGAGLGLVIARRLAEVHGGRFSVQSRPAHGTTVTVQLLLAE